MEFCATVVVTTKNRREELRRALRSAFSQSVPIEVLVLDDGSTDGTSEMVSSEFPQARLYSFRESSGYIVRRNEASRLASSEIVVSIDDDAEFSSERVIEQSLANFTDSRIVAVAIPLSGANGRVWPRPQQSSECYVTDAFIGTAHAVRRDVFLQLNGYRESLIHQGEESDFCIRGLEAGHVVRVGNSDPIHHHESPRRNFRRMDFYGRRNDILFAWHNVPWPYLSLHLIATTFNGVIFATRTRSAVRVRDLLAGLLRGYVDCLKYVSRRQPVSRGIYRLSRRLKKNGPLPLAQIESRLRLCGVSNSEPVRTPYFRTLLPDRPVRVRVIRGPFRGARLFLNPRHSLRKIFGLYEHELNHWIENALSKVNTVIDVGASDGYFTFGCAAAFRRLKRSAEIFAFEPQPEAYAQLVASAQHREENGSQTNKIDIKIQQRFVGAVESDQCATLDTLVQWQPSCRALIKIDVEGMELDVIAGASQWLTRSNLFLIEVHDSSFIERIQRSFAAAGLGLKSIVQRPLPLLGRETREKENSWLVSQLRAKREPSENTAISEVTCPLETIIAPKR